MLGATGQQQPIDAMLDTGFSGFLTLPPSLVASLGLTWLGREQGAFADGTVELVDVYRAAVLWEGQPRPAEVDEVDGTPLLGGKRRANIRTRRVSLEMPMMVSWGT